MLTLLLIFAFDPKSSADAEFVQEVIPGACQIIHIRDWHWIPKASYAVDTGLSGNELDQAYAQHVKDVEAVQMSIRRLVVNARKVYAEGLSDKTYPIFRTEIRALRPFHKEISQLDPATGPETEKILEEHKLTLLRLGAAGQLMLEGKLAVLPCEGEEYHAAQPLQNGKIEIDEKANEAREDAIVRRLSRGGVLILGGAHDLSDNIRRLTRECGYTLVTPRGYPK